MALDITLLYAILEGAGVAALAAAVGYVKSQEAFELEKFGDTVALGAVLGAVAGFYGIPVVDAQNVLVSLGLFASVVYLLDAGVKALVRYLRGRFAKAA